MKLISLVLLAPFFLAACSPSPVAPVAESPVDYHYRPQDRDLTVSLEGGRLSGAAYIRQEYVHTLHFRADDASDGAAHGDLEGALRPFDRVEQIDAEDHKAPEAVGDTSVVQASMASEKTHVAPSYSHDEMARWKRWCSGEARHSDYAFAEKHGGLDGVPSDLRANCNPTFK